jgi:hypothetical protein
VFLDGFAHCSFATTECGPWGTTCRLGLLLRVTDQQQRPHMDHHRGSNSEELPPGFRHCLLPSASSDDTGHRAILRHEAFDNRQQCQEGQLRPRLCMSPASQPTPANAPSRDTRLLLIASNVRGLLRPRLHTSPASHPMPANAPPRDMRLSTIAGTCQRTTPTEAAHVTSLCIPPCFTNLQQHILICTPVPTRSPSSRTFPSLSFR